MDVVGCAGILVADTICGPMDSLPEEGQLLAIDSLPTTAGGCGANVAINLGKQGIASGVAGRLGRDPSAQVVLNELRKIGADTERITYSDAQPTSQTIILLVRGQDRRFIHVFGANKEFAVSHIDRDWVAGLKVLYLGGLFVLPAILTDELVDLFAFCRSQGVVTMLDVVIPLHQTGMNGIDRVLPYVDYFVPNDDEARLLTGLSDPLDQASLFQACGAGTVIITQGKHGLLGLRGHDMWRAEAFQVEAVDPSGGGDAFSAGIITGIVRGWDMPQMLTYGAVLGASATLAPGTTTGVFTEAQAETFLQSHRLNISHETVS
ncbi:MAG: carbohydrate kinase family protein [Anaerolineae bacterium]|nr:carbohydrate kinase family protein [Anaerolineae bacterium]